MAKKKKTDEEENGGVTTVDYRQRLRDSISEKFKADLMKEASFLKDDKRIVIPISPAVDRGIHGGIPEGSWVILSGPPKMGKTTLALQLAANAQKPEYGNKTVYYLDVEGRLKEMNLESIRTLEMGNMEYIRSTQEKLLTAEEYLTIAMDIIKGHPGCVLIIDSASQLCAAKELMGDITAQARNDGPKLLATFTRQMCNVVPIQKTIVVIIQHMIADTSGTMGGPKTIEDGGNKIKYQVDVKLRGKSFEKWVDTESNQIGQIAHWDVVCSALGQPGAKIDNYIRFGYGVDEVVELVNLAAEFGIIEKKGAWYSFEKDGEEIKAQGLEKLCTLLRENPDKCEFVKTQLAAV